MAAATQVSRDASFRSGLVLRQLGAEAFGFPQLQCEPGELFVRHTLSSRIGAIQLTKHADENG